MWVDVREVEFSCNEEEDGAHSCESRVAAGLAFGGLEEAVERFDEAVGLAGFVWAIAQQVPPKAI